MDELQLCCILKVRIINSWLANSTKTFSNKSITGNLQKSKTKALKRNSHV
jgi:hypothetical protein